MEPLRNKKVRSLAAAGALVMAVAGGASVANGNSEAQPAPAKVEITSANPSATTPETQPAESTTPTTTTEPETTTPPTTSPENTDTPTTQVESTTPTTESGYFVYDPNDPTNYGPKPDQGETTDGNDAILPPDSTPANG